MTSYHAYMRELMNAKDSDVGYQIGMRVWQLRGGVLARAYLDEVMEAHPANTRPFTVARRLRTLLTPLVDAEVSS